MEVTGNLVKNLITQFQSQLSGLYPPDEIRQFVYMLFDEFLGWNKPKVHLSVDTEISDQAMVLFNSALKELCTGKPVQYLLGKAWFDDLLLAVDQNVLVPRPETAELCALIKSDLYAFQDKQLSILDIGTGSGCIAIDLKKNFPGAKVTAIDISAAALEIARVNAKAHDCEVLFIQADILNLTSLPGLEQFNVIVSNPPYVTESERTLMHRNVIEFEPHIALFVSDHDPLIFYRNISSFAIKNMIPPACLYLEINERLGNEVKELVLSFGFDEAKVLPDIHGKERFVKASLKAPSTHRV